MHIEDKIKLPNKKLVRGFATVELFDVFGKKILEKRTENTLTSQEMARLEWRTRWDFFNGHPHSVLNEPLYPLRSIVLDYSSDTQIYESGVKNIGNIIGFANKAPYSGSSLLQGSLNTTESYSTSSKVHWVFDWQTHAGNGTFNSIKWGYVAYEDYYFYVYNTIRAPTSGFCGLAWDGMYLWYARRGSRSLWKINPENGEVVSLINDIGKYPIALAWDGSYLRFIDNNDKKIYRFDVGTQEVVDSIAGPCANPKGLEWDGNYLWVSGQNPSAIYKINPSTGSIITQFPFDGYALVDIAWDGSNLWFVVASSNKIYKVNPSNGQVIGHMFTHATSPSGLTWDGHYLWIGNYPTIGQAGYLEQFDALIGTVTNLTSPITKTNNNTMKVTYDFVFNE